MPLGYQAGDEVLRYQRQTEQTWEGDEADETQHLAEHLAQTAHVAVVGLGECRLGHAHNHTPDGGNSHVVPLARVAEDTCHTGRVESAQKDSEDVVVELQEQVLHQ